MLFAAVLSPTGGSFRILQESRARLIQLVIIPYVIEEVERALGEKYPAFVPRFHVYLELFPFSIEPNPSRRLVAGWRDGVPEEDAPILAAAKKARAACLLTLDKKDFLRNKKLKKRRPPFHILTPGAFIKQYFG